MIPATYDVRLLPASIAKLYIHKHHYMHGSSNCPSPCYGLFDGDCGLFGGGLLGVAMISVPASEAALATVYGSERVREVKDFSRMHILDVTPKNTESWFISRVLDRLKEDRPEVTAVMTAADPTFGFDGGIYRATNAIYYGLGDSAEFYVDAFGRVRSKRQCGVNISRRQAQKLGWKWYRGQRKYRYLWLLGDKREQKKNKDVLRIKDRPWIKGGDPRIIPFLATNEYG